MCAGLIKVLLAERRGGDAHQGVLELDSIVRPVPLEASWGGRDLTFGLDNLVLAQLLARHGEPVLALAAVRRGRPRETLFAVLSLGLIVDYLREEGRLAAMTGDTAGAVVAYRHYLALREDPQGPWRAQRDSVAAELAALGPRR